jgi:hypothetical protein
MSDTPIVCTLNPDDLAARREALLPGLIRRAEDVEWRHDGCRLRFAASTDVLRLIVAVIDAERQCCRFLQFELTVEPNLGPIWLGLTGASGTVGMLKGLLA